MGEMIRPGDIPWDDCPHRRRFEDRMRYMDELTEKMVQSVSAELNAVAADIKNEVQHQGELTGQQFRMLEEHITRVEKHVSAHDERLRRQDERLDNLEKARGQTSWEFLKWVGAALGGGLLTFAVARLLGG